MKYFPIIFWFFVVVYFGSQVARILWDWHRWRCMSSRFDHNFENLTRSQQCHNESAVDFYSDQCDAALQEMDKELRK